MCVQRITFLVFVLHELMQLNVSFFLVLHVLCTFITLSYTYHFLPLATFILYYLLLLSSLLLSPPDAGWTLPYHPFS